MRKTSSKLRKYYASLKKTQVSSGQAVLLLAVASFVLGAVVWDYSSRMTFPAADIITEGLDRPTPQPASEAERVHPKPGPVSMEKMKTQGCVADGILSGYGGDSNSAISMINRSNCYYLHRAIETWANPPDFKLVDKLLWDFKNPNMVYGMFIAEAIRKNADYYYPDKDRDFDFSDMCRGHTDNRYGEHTCIPSFEKEEYREYLKYITRQAMDLGVQSFMFGQIYLQDTANDLDHSHVYEVVKDMRDYAKEKGIQIVIGAQTNNITNERYLGQFDYIEGGVGIDSQGNVENGPCLSRKSSCWALLWNDIYAKKAKNVFLHLDWSGLTYDDMSVFARMDKATRENTLKNLHAYFNSKDMGFLMPFTAVVNKNNGGCYGPKKSFYSASNKYGCKDEDAINSILSGS